MPMIKSRVSVAEKVFPNFSLFLKNNIRGLPMRDRTNAKPINRISSLTSIKNQTKKKTPTNTDKAFNIPMAIDFAVVFTK